MLFLPFIMEPDTHISSVTIIKYRLFFLLWSCFGRLFIRILDIEIGCFINKLRCESSWRNTHQIWKVQSISFKTQFIRVYVIKSIIFSCTYSKGNPSCHSRDVSVNRDFYFLDFLYHWSKWKIVSVQKLFSDVLFLTFVQWHFENIQWLLRRIRFHEKILLFYCNNLIKRQCVLRKYVNCRIGRNIFFDLLSILSW